MKSKPHCIGRALERYGLVLSFDDLRTMESMIRGKQSLLIRRDKGGREIHALQFRNEAVRLVYAPGDGRIITFLPAKARRMKDAIARKCHPRIVEAMECTGENR